MADRIQDLGIFTAYGEAREAGYEGTKAEFEEGLKKAAEAYDEAEAAAAAAAQSATAAAASAVDASTAAAEADSSANAAQASEVAADVSAGAAASSAIDAGESADAASAAQTGAETAQVAAELAQTAAEAAATAADGSKTAAAGSATSASSSATSASGSATAAAGSATAASGSASDAAASATAAAGSAADSADSATAAAASAAQAASLGINKADVIVCSAFGSIASFPDGADDMPVKELNVAIEPAQTGSGDPSPDNVRPISGWTGAKVTRTGKNLLKLIEAEAIKGGYDFYIPNPILMAGSYKLTCQNAFGGSPLLGCAVVFRDSVGGTNVGGYYAGYGFGDESREGITTTITEEQANAQYIVFLARSSGLTFSGLSDAEIQIELGSTATAYEPYQGGTYDIAFPSEAGTVYGGTLDTTSGVLTVDRAMVDLGTLRWAYNETYASFVTSSLETRKSGILNILSDLFKTQAGSWSGTPLTNAIWGNASDTTIYVQYPITEVSEFLSLISGHQLVYELATPITYQLTPQEVTTLIGTNNIWADTGDVSVAYKADTKLYIDKKFAELQALILEN